MHRPVPISVRAAALPGLAVACVWAACQPANPRPPAPNAAVHGQVFLKLGAVETTQALPDIVVILRDSVTQAVVDKQTTDLGGRYLSQPVPNGVYEQCWEAPGFRSGCRVVRVSGYTAFPGRIYVAPEIKREGGTVAGFVRGRVTLSDNSFCRFTEPAFAIDQTAHVTAVDAAHTTIAGPVRANSRGEYALPNVPRTPFTLVALCDAQQAVRPEAATAAFDGALHDLMVINRRPRLYATYAVAGGRVVNDVPLGTSVTVTASARDADGDPLTYRWQPGADGGTVSSPTGPTTVWTLPAANEGVRALTVLVSDNRGGLARQAITLNVGPVKLRMSGTVVDQNGTAVSGATVSINGAVILTNAAGGFLAPVKDTTRYVVNITKPGYALTSVIFNHPVMGHRYLLERGFEVNVDPTQPIDVTDQPGQYDPKVRGRDVVRHGVRVQVPADALVDANGIAPSGNLSLTLQTRDLTRTPLPGDYGAFTAGGAEQRLESFGAASVTFRDAGGVIFNLKAGATARLTLPVMASQLVGPNAAPATIPFWSYDTVSGYWREYARAKLIGSAYEVEVPHLSELNTDLSKSTASCIRVHLDATLPVNRTINVKVPSVTPQTLQIVADNVLNAVWRLPPNTAVTFEPLDDTGQPIQLAVQTVNSGPATPELWPPSPYTSCGSDVFLGIAIPAPPPDFLTFKGVGSAAEAAAYYADVDPQSLRTTLGAWWSVNGFGSDGQGGTEAAYLNDNDLGFGRRMSCRQNGADVACYVTNFGGPDQNLGNADQAVGNVAADRKAAVAMEYSAVEGLGGEPKRVKFFVFAPGAVAGTARVDRADLDGNGDKFVPRLCMMCHGGQYNAGTPRDTRSSFREFDLTSFKYSPLLDRPAQEVAFQQLNNIVAASNPWPPINQLIGVWNSAGLPQPPDAVVSGWTGNPQQNLYVQVVGTTCRTCHIAQDNGGTGDDAIDWSTYGMFHSHRLFIQGLACGPSKDMPQAKITYNNFWSRINPHRPSVLGSFVDGANWAVFANGCK
jgi:Bacterial Ig domain